MATEISPAGDTVTKTFWLTPEGHIATHVVAKDAAGNIYGESGEPAPAGTELTSEDIARIFRQQINADREAYEARQKEAKKARAAAIEDREAQREKLRGAGFDDDVVDILMPALEAAPVVRPYSPPSVIQQSMAQYGLSEDQIQRVVGGWT